MVAPPAGTGAAGLLTYWTATSTVSSSLSLFWDNPNIRLGVGTSQPSSTLHIIAGTTGATTLQLMGLPNQTGNLLSIGSSSGQRYFTLSSLGVASSTEFRSPSSTIDVLTLTSASSTNLDVATRFNFAAASSTGNLTIGGTFQSNAGQTTLASVSSTNLFGSGYLNFISGRADLQAVSSTNFSASGYGLFPTLLAQNAVGLGSLSSSTSLVFIRGTETASTSLNIQGTANQTSPLLTIASSTGIPLFNINALGQIAISTSTYPASSTLLTIASSSQIFNISSGGNVMIGTSTAPNGALLTIATTSNIFTVLSTGQIGILTTTPSSTLDVAGTANLRGAAGTTGLYVNSSGNVGIGTTAPIGALDLSSTADRQIFIGASSDPGWTRPGIQLGSRGVFGSSDSANNPMIGSNVYLGSGDGQYITTNTATRLVVGLTQFFFQTAVSGTAGTNITWSDRMAVDNNGNVGIGTTNPDSIKLDVEDDIEIGTGTTGCVRDADNTTLVGSCVSDERLKKNIASLPSSTLDQLLQLRPVTFEWRNDEFNWLNGQPGLNYGLIAQEVEQVFPDMINTDDRGYKRVSYDIGLTMRLLRGIRELNNKTASLFFRVEDLEHILASSSSTSGTSNQPSGTETIVSAVIAQLHNAYDIIFDKGLLKVAHLITDLIETKRVVTDELQLKDSQTGAMYCVTIKNGEFEKVQGVCGGSATTTEATSSTPTP